MPQKIDNDFIATILVRLNIPPSAVHDLIQSLRRPALPQSGATDHLTQVTADVLRNTHFRFKGCKSLAVSATGSRPGDPTADIVFNFAFNAVLCKIRGKFLAAQLCDTHAFDGSNLPRAEPGVDPRQVAIHTDVTFFDDTRNIFVDADAARLIARLKTAAAIVDDCCIEAGLLPKYSPQKTIIHQDNHQSNRTPNQSHYQAN